MRLFDPTISTIPSFQRRATARLAELARLQAALSYTEGWDSPRIQEVLRDARRLRHGLRSLALGTDLSLDEQRFICERLLPILPEQTAAPAPPAPAPASVSLALTQAQLFIIGVSTAASLRVVVGSNVPAGTKLVLLRDGQQVQQQAAAAGAALLTDTSPGQLYTAQLWYNNQVLAAARLQLDREYPVRWGVLPVGTSAVTDEGLASFGATPSGTRLNLTFAVKAGRGNLAIVIPPNYQWAVKDPRLNTDLSASFQASNQVLNVVGVGQVPVVVLRQPTPVIGPFSFPAILELT